MKKNWRKIIIIIAASCFLLLFLINKIFFFKRTILESAAANITYPFLWLGSKIAKPIENIFSHKKNYHKLLSENILLKQKNEDLISKFIELNSTINFDTKSQEILDFKKRYELNNAIFANIIVKNITNNEHYFFINKGSIHNIRKDMVATYKFQIIGKVTDVFRWYSKVLLVTDKKCKIAANTNNTNASGICEGINKIDKLKFNFVDHFATIEMDDFVISSGQGLIFPEGFCLGTITQFNKNGLYYDIEIEPLVEIKKLKNCLITDQEKINLL
ncbi:MAG: rod shape-determining protein MreC [bacterium]